MSRYGHLSVTDSFQSPDKILIYFLKKKKTEKTICQGNTDTKPRPQRVNSYELNLFITDTAVIRWVPNRDRVNLHRVNPVKSGWLTMQGDK